MQGQDLEQEQDEKQEQVQEQEQGQEQEQEQDLRVNSRYEAKQLTVFTEQQDLIKLFVVCTSRRFLSGKRTIIQQHFLIYDKCLAIKKRKKNLLSPFVTKLDTKQDFFILE